MRRKTHAWNHDTGYTLCGLDRARNKAIYPSDVSCKDCKEKWLEVVKEMLLSGRCEGTTSMVNII